MPVVPLRLELVLAWQCWSPTSLQLLQVWYGCSLNGKKTGKPGLVGIVTGTIAGLATITPASGSVGPMGAVIIGATVELSATLLVASLRKSLGLMIPSMLQRSTVLEVFLEP